MSRYKYGRYPLSVSGLLDRNQITHADEIDCITDSDPLRFASKVQERLNDRWRLYGGPTEDEWDNRKHYVQFVVRFNFSRTVEGQ